MNIITFKTIKTFKPTHVEGSFSSSHSCFWHFETRETSLSTLGGVTLLTSNGGAIIHGPDFSSIFGRDKIPLVFSFLYKGSWTPFPSFFIVVHNLQSLQTSKLITHQIVHHIFKNPNSSPIRSFIIFSKRDFKDPQELRRSVRALVYVSFIFTTSFISSNNLLSSSFSHL